MKIGNEFFADPDSGLVGITEAALKTIVKTDPIEKWYTLDPEPIARGRYAVLRRCRNQVTGEEFAAKFLSKVRFGANCSQGKDCTDDIFHEVAVCHLLQATTKIVHLHDVFATDTQMILIMEFAPGGDLQTLLDADIVPFECDVVSFLRQILTGLVYIHENGIAHLDIKPQNIVMMGDYPDCDIKLCDFDISRYLSPGHEVRELLGTSDYVAPEILLGEPITTCTDMWSFGVLTYVLLTGFLPFGGEDEQVSYKEIIRCDEFLEFPSELFEDITPEAIDFIEKLLIRQPSRRLSAKDCLQHSWMRQSQQHQGPGRPAQTTPQSITTHSDTLLSPNITYSPSSNINDSSLRTPPTSLSFCSTPNTSKNSDTSLNLIHTPTSALPPVPPSTMPRTPSETSRESTPTPNFHPSTSSMPPIPPSVLSRQESQNSSKTSPVRPNFDRLRSLSKAREVLSERVQMSNLKKTISKSRERLWDLKYGLSRSRESLLNLKAISQSVDTLPMFTQDSNARELGMSHSSVFLPNLGNCDEKHSVSCRMYKSLASIDQIGHNESSRDYEKERRWGYFDSRLSLNDGDYSNDVLTWQNTQLNSAVSNSSINSRREKLAKNSKHSFGAGNSRRDNTYKGSETTNVSSNTRLTRNQRRSERQSAPKISRASRMKRDAHRRRKEKQEKKTNELTERTRKETKKPEQSSTPPTISRRRSISHIEERMQEKHERLLEKERQEKVKQENRTKRRGSLDIDKSSVCEKFKTSKGSLSLCQERPRSTTPTRRSKVKKESGSQSDVSQASSMESVDGGSLSHSKVGKGTELMEINICADSSTHLGLVRCEDENDNIVGTDARGDVDEAYISLDEPSVLSRSRSVVSNNSADSDNSDRTLTDAMKQDTPAESPTTMLTKDENLIATRNSESRQGKNISKDDNTQSTELKNNIRNAEGKFGSGELTIIKENETLKTALTSSYIRSTSTSSDIGSMVSESSENSLTEEQQKGQFLDYDFNTPIRTRSQSINSGTRSQRHPTRSRSNSIHLESTTSGEDQARPWGKVCNGSIARALEKFSIGSVEKQPSNLSRRQSSPQIKPLPSFSQSDQPR